MHLMCGTKPHVRSLLHIKEAGVFSEDIHIYFEKMWFAALQSVSLVQLSSSPLVGINSRAVLSPEPSRRQVFPATASSLWRIALKIVSTSISPAVLHYRRLPRVSSVGRKTKKKSFRIHTGLFLRTKGINHIYRDKPFRMELVFHTDVETHPFHLISYLPFLIIKTRLHKPTIS